MSERQTESVNAIKKIDHWIEFLSVMRQITQEEASNEAVDEFISDKIIELINKVNAAWKQDETIRHTTFRLEYKDGREVAFGLTCELAKPGSDDEEWKGGD